MATIDVCGANDNTIRPAGQMLTARRSFAAGALTAVLFLGGYDAAATCWRQRNFRPVKASRWRVPRARHAGHQAHALPNNGKVLIFGGTDGNNPLATAETYSPVTGKLEATGPMHSARTSMASAVARRGGVAVAGGRGESGLLSGTEVYNFATVESDKGDYAPGEAAYLTGQGWKPGEQVALSAAAFPLDQHRTEFTAVAQADANGQVQFAGFQIDRSHLGKRFLVTATGSESQAQTVFTDAESTTVTINVSNPSQTYGTSVTVSGQVSGASTNPVNAGNAAVLLDGLAVQTNGVDPAGNYSYTSSTIVPGVHSFSVSYAGNAIPWARVAQVLRLTP